MAVTVGKPAELGGAEAAQRAALRTMQERRARIWRRLALVAIVSAIIVALLVAQRDNQTRRHYREQLEGLQHVFEEGRARSGSPPAALGVVERDNPAWDLCYFNPTYVDRAARRGRSGVAAMRAPVNLIFNPDGRFLLMFDGKDYHVEWIDEAQFRAVAASLGLGLAVAE